MKLYTPCCGVPMLGRPFDCMCQHREWEADGRPVGDYCRMTERPRPPIVLESRDEQMGLGLP